MHYLSIISPFYNSEEKCHRLLSTLSKIEDKGVEVILVDDGSTDRTVTLLEDFKHNSKVEVVVIAQENKGPGAARNSGLVVAKGDYVWFVDSDDDINLEALDVLKQSLDRSYDFIDFNYSTKGIDTNSMDFNPGIYNVEDHNRSILLKNFGRICTKIFRKEFIIQNNVYYPEYCIYEDNPLSMIYPLITKKFLKSDLIAYHHLEDFLSITRGKPNARYFDRLYTSIYGYEKSYKLAHNDTELNLLKYRFSVLHINTLNRIITKKPSRNWLIMYKIMKHFRVTSKHLNIQYDIQNFISHQSIKYQLFFRLNWYLSYLHVGDPSKFFETQRLEAWNRPFNN